MKIFITGASGFLGQKLAEKLIKDGHEVTAQTRKHSEELKKTSAKQEIITLDDKKNLIEALKGKEIIYHLAANLDESDPNMEKENIMLTKNVIDAAKTAGIDRIIFPSSSGVLGETTIPATESMPYNPKTRYEKSKTQCEKLIKTSGIPYTIARMTIIYGPNHFWQQIFNAAKKDYPLIGSGKNMFHLVYIDDAVDALTLMLRPDAEDQTYNIADSDPHTYHEVYTSIRKTLNMPPPRRQVPSYLAKTGALMHETSSRIKKERPKVTKMRSSIDRLIRNRIVSIKKAEKDLGYKPKYTLEEGLRKTWEELEKSTI